MPEQTLASAGYLDVVIGILDGLAGEKDASEKRRVVRAALFEGQRRKEETLSQFAVRREQEFIGADRYLSIPSELKAFILEETAGLSRQGLQNLRTLTGGTVDFDKVVGALKTLDVEEEPLTKGKGGLFSGLAEDSEPGQGTAEPESDVEDDYGERADAFLAQIDDVDEDTALEMLNAFEKEDAKTTERRRTWKQNKDRKAAARKDRRVFSRPRLTVGDLKERTRCANCGERGHWRAECKKPSRSKEERGRAEGKGADSGRRAVAFVYLGAEPRTAMRPGTHSWVWRLAGHLRKETADRSARPPRTAPRRRCNPGPTARSGTTRPRTPSRKRFTRRTATRSGTRRPRTCPRERFTRRTATRSGTRRPRTSSRKRFARRPPTASSSTWPRRATLCACWRLSPDMPFSTLARPRTSSARRRSTDCQSGCGSKGSGA